MIGRIDAGSGVPIYVQIAEGLRDSIAAGRLKPGDRLPTVREAAVRLRVNPGTVVAAYDELAREGLLVARQGAGTFVSLAADRAASPRRAARARLERLVEAAARAAEAAGVSVADVRRLLDRAVAAVRRTRSVAL